MRQRPEVDLTGGKYDDFETMLSQKLGLKVILARGWKSSDEFSRARAMMSFARDPAEYDKAKKNFDAAEDRMMGSLRANLVDRDPQVGHALSDNDLRALQSTGHITLRSGNAEREQAVIVFDPAGFGYGDEDPVLRFALTEYFDNAWNCFSDDAPRSIPVRDVIENFSMDAEDKRRYQAVMNVRYALQNQSEYNNKDKGWYFEPFYYNFARLSDREPGLWKEPFQMPLADVAKKLDLERHWKPEKMGIADPDFFEKLKLGGAIMSLRYSILDTHPNATFARLELADRVAPMEVVLIQRDLRQRLQEKLVEHRKNAEHDYGLDSSGLEDFRILFPLFREIYEADKSEGPKRLYLDTIMAGLQKWFPTLTNGPVPDLKEGCLEPPRSLPAAQNTPPAAIPKPGPAAPSA